MKSLREAAANARIARCRSINEDPEPRMRHCESCEVPITTMSLEVFEAMSVCPVCGKAVHCVFTEQAAKGRWITVEMAEIRYKISRGKLYQLVNNGILTSKEVLRGRVILESEVAAMRDKREWVE